MNKPRKSHGSRTAPTQALEPQGLDAVAGGIHGDPAPPCEPEQHSEPLVRARPRHRKRR